MVEIHTQRDLEAAAQPGDLIAAKMQQVTKKPRCACRARTPALLVATAVISAVLTAGVTTAVFNVQVTTNDDDGIVQTKTKLNFGRLQEDEARRTAAITGRNQYRYEQGLGTWGGTCTCPDGQEYSVADNGDWCGSLACEGGVPSKCGWWKDVEGAGMKVTCAPPASEFVPVNGTSSLGTCDGKNRICGYDEAPCSSLHSESACASACRSDYKCMAYEWDSTQSRCQLSTDCLAAFNLDASSPWSVHIRVPGSDFMQVSDNGISTGSCHGRNEICNHRQPPCNEIETRAGCERECRRHDDCISYEWDSSLARCQLSSSCDSNNFKGDSRSHWVTYLKVLGFGLDEVGLFEKLGVGVEVAINDAHCNFLDPDGLHDAEDFALTQNGLLLMSSGDLHNVFFETGSAAAHAGAVWGYDMREGGKADPVQLQVHGLDKHFQPHGIYYSNRTQRLYAVNHGLEESSVEIFQVEFDIDCLDVPAPWPCEQPAALRHVRSVASSLLPHYTLNDVVEGLDDNELYVTRWLKWSLPKEGASNGNLWDRLTQIAWVFYQALDVKQTDVYRCTWEGVNDPAVCAVASDTKFITANGITTDTDRSRYFVNDLAALKINVFNRRADDGFLQLEDTIKLPEAVDNLEFDHASGQLLMGSIPIAYKALLHQYNADTVVPGGAMVGTQVDQGQWSFEHVVVHDGSDLSQVSSMARYGSRVVVGSPYSPGMLVCEA